MEKLSKTAKSRAQLFQMLSLGFLHPVKEFYRLIENGSYPLAVARAAQAALGMDTIMGHAQTDYQEFEANYIRLFQVGKGGRPIIYLNAGDYEELLGSGSRPEFLLEYSAWYRHFGLKTNEADQANELPDHLTCQLEFLTWLVHLEYSSADKPELQTGYQSAQRDFCQRHLCPMLDLLVTAMQRENQRNPVPSFLFKLVLVSQAAASTLLEKLVETLGEEALQTDNPDQIASVNLWG